MGHNNQISGQDRHQHRQQPAPGAYQPSIHEYYDYILSNWKVYCLHTSQKGVHCHSQYIQLCNIFMNLKKNWIVLSYLSSELCWVR